MIKLKIVDLPTPFGPSKPKICPWLIAKLTLSKIFLFPKDSDNLSSFIIGFSVLKDLIRNFLIIAINLIYTYNFYFF